MAIRWTPEELESMRAFDAEIDPECREKQAISEEKKRERNREYGRRWYARHREKAKKKRRDRYLAHREEELARQKDYTVRNRSEINRKARERYQRKKEERERKEREAGQADGTGLRESGCTVQ